MQHPPDIRLCVQERKNYTTTPILEKGNRNYHLRVVCLSTQVELEFSSICLQWPSENFVKFCSRSHLKLSFDKVTEFMVDYKASNMDAVGKKLQIPRDGLFTHTHTHIQPQQIVWNILILSKWNIGYSYLGGHSDLCWYPYEKWRNELFFRYLL